MYSLNSGLLCFISYLLIIHLIVMHVAEGNSSMATKSFYSQTTMSTIALESSTTLIQVQENSSSSSSQHQTDSSTLISAPTTSISTDSILNATPSQKSVSTDTKINITKESTSSISPYTSITTTNLTTSKSPDTIKITTDSTTSIFPDTTEITTESTLSISPETTINTANSTTSISLDPTEITTDSTKSIFPDTTEITTDSTTSIFPVTTVNSTDSTTSIIPVTTVNSTDSTISISPVTTVNSTDSTTSISPGTTEITRKSTSSIFRDTTETTTGSTTSISPDTTETTTDSSSSLFPNTSENKTDSSTFVFPDKTVTATDSTTSIFWDTIEIKTNLTTSISPDTTEIMTESTTSISRGTTEITTYSTTSTSPETTEITTYSTTSISPETTENTTNSTTSISPGTTEITTNSTTSIFPDTTENTTDSTSSIFTGTTAITTYSTTSISPDTTEITAESKTSISPDTTEITTESTTSISPDTTEITTYSRTSLSPETTEITTDSTTSISPETTENTTNSTTLIFPDTTEITTDSSTSISPETTEITTDSTTSISPDTTEITTDSTTSISPETTENTADSTTSISPETTEITTNSTTLIFPDTTETTTDSTASISPYTTETTTDSTSSISPDITETTTDSTTSISMNTTASTSVSSHMVFHNTTTFVTTTPDYNSIASLYIERQFNIAPSIRLTCTFSASYLIISHSNFTFEWCKDGRTLGSSLRLVINSPVWNGTGQPVLQSVLYIKNAVLLDEGNYTCLFKEDRLNLRINDTLYVKVYQKPQLSITPVKVFVPKHQVQNITCRIKNFDRLEERTNIVFNWTSFGQKYTNSSTSTVRLNVTQDVDIICMVDGQNATAKIKILKEEKKQCKEDTTGDITWTIIPAGDETKHDCGEGYKGFVTRKCDVNGRWKPENYSDCFNEKIKDAEAILDGISKDNKTVVDAGSVNTALESIQSVVESSPSSSSNSKQLEAVNIVKTVGILDKISKIEVKITDLTTAKDTTDSFVGVVDTVLSKSEVLKAYDSHDGKERPKKSASTAKSLVSSVEKFGDKVLKNLKENQNITVKKDNIVLLIKNTAVAKIDFPLDDTNAKRRESSSFSLPKDALSDHKEMKYTAVKYSSLGDLFGDVKHEKSSKGGQINSDILALSINGVTQLKSKLTLTFHHNEHNLSLPICSYLDLNTSEWLGSGCDSNPVKSSDNVTVCECSHLTNFAILMSLAEPSAEDYERLRLISIVGCSFSIAGAILTIVIYLRLWRYVKSRRSVLVVNLCVSLTVAYLLFLIGVEHSEDKIVCTVIAALLHYFFLSMFTIMLALGIDLAVAILSVFSRRSSSFLLLLLSWGLPAIIVGVTLGATRRVGYGDEKFCWLRGETLYGFIVPVLIIIFCNIVILFVVMRVMFQSTSMIKKSTREKAVSGVRSMCALLPILGLTWVFGIMAINEDFIICQYLFAIFNSLQGLFIFIFHCVLNTTVRKGIRQKIRQFESRNTSLSTSKRNPLLSSRQNSRSDILKDSDDEHNMYTQEKSTTSSGYNLPRLSVARL